MTAPARSHETFESEEDRAIARAYTAGADVETIASCYGRTVASIRNVARRLGIYRPHYMREDNLPVLRNADGIVEQAKTVLRRRFQDRRGVWILDGTPCDLARLMTEANKVLVGHGMPQLGRNPAWLVSEMPANENDPINFQTEGDCNAPL